MEIILKPSTSQSNDYQRYRLEGKQLNRLLLQDTEDESLARYKRALLGNQADFIASSPELRKISFVNFLAPLVEIVTIEILCEDRP